MTNSQEIVQYVLGAHWEKRSAVSIAASVRFKFKVDASPESIKAIIAKWTLKHHGTPVLRKDWPCAKIET